MGRGTARRSRGVEGFCFRFTKTQDRISNAVRVCKDLFGCDAHDFDPVIVQPLRATFVPLRARAKIVRGPVNFDAELCGGAIEIEHIRSGRMLPADAERRRAEPLPK